MQSVAAILSPAQYNADVMLCPLPARRSERPRQETWSTFFGPSSLVQGLYDAPPPARRTEELRLEKWMTFLASPGSDQDLYDVQQLPKFAENGPGVDCRFFNRDGWKFRATPMGPAVKCKDRVEFFVALEKSLQGPPPYPALSFLSSKYTFSRLILEFDVEPDEYWDEEYVVAHARTVVHEVSRGKSPLADETVVVQSRPISSNGKRGYRLNFPCVVIDNRERGLWAKRMGSAWAYETEPDWGAFKSGTLRLPYTSKQVNAVANVYCATAVYRHGESTPLVFPRIGNAWAVYEAMGRRDVMGPLPTVEQTQEILKFHLGKCRIPPWLVFLGGLPYELPFMEDMIPLYGNGIEFVYYDTKESTTARRYLSPVNEHPTCWALPSVVIAGLSTREAIVTEMIEFSRSRTAYRLRDTMCYMTKETARKVEFIGVSRRVETDLLNSERSVFTLVLKDVIAFQSCMESLHASGLATWEGPSLNSTCFQTDCRATFELLLEFKAVDQWISDDKIKHGEYVTIRFSEKLRSFVLDSRCGWFSEHFGSPFLTTDFSGNMRCITSPSEDFAQRAFQYVHHEFRHVPTLTVRSFCRCGDDRFADGDTAPMEPDQSKFRWKFIRSPMGSGKSTLAARMVEIAASKGYICIMIAPRKALVEQFIEKQSLAGITWTSYKQRTQVGESNYIATTVHSLHVVARRLGVRVYKHPLFIIVDEYVTILEDFGNTTSVSGSRGGLLDERNWRLLASMSSLPSSFSVFIDANLSALSVSLLASQAASLRPSCTELELYTLESSFSDVVRQTRKAFVYAWPGAEVEAYHRCESIVMGGGVVSVFFASKRKLHEWQESLIRAGAIYEDDCVVFTGDERPVTNESAPSVRRVLCESDAPEGADFVDAFGNELRRGSTSTQLVNILQQRKCFFYTSAACCGVDIAFPSNARYFDHLFIIGADARHLSVLSVLQATGRIRNVSDVHVVTTNRIASPLEVLSNVDFLRMASGTFRDYVAKNCETRADNELGFYSTLNDLEDYARMGVEFDPTDRVTLNSFMQILALDLSRTVCEGLLLNVFLSRLKSSGYKLSVVYSSEKRTDERLRLDKIAIELWECKAMDRDPPSDELELKENACPAKAAEKAAADNSSYERLLTCFFYFKTHGINELTYKAAKLWVLRFQDFAERANISGGGSASMMAVSAQLDCVVPRAIALVYLCHLYGLDLGKDFGKFQKRKPVSIPYVDLDKLIASGDFVGRPSSAEDFDILRAHVEDRGSPLFARNPARCLLSNCVHRWIGRAFWCSRRGVVTHSKTDDLSRAIGYWAEECDKSGLLGDMDIDVYSPWPAIYQEWLDQKSFEYTDTDSIRRKRRRLERAADSND